jgi:hypothetical protein
MLWLEQALPLCCQPHQMHAVGPVCRVQPAASCLQTVPLPSTYSTQQIEQAWALTYWQPTIPELKIPWRATHQRCSGWCLSTWQLSLFAEEAWGGALAHKQGHLQCCAAHMSNSNYSEPRSVSISQPNCCGISSKLPLHAAQSALHARASWSQPITHSRAPAGFRCLECLYITWVAFHPHMRPAYLCPPCTRLCPAGAVIALHLYQNELNLQAVGQHECNHDCKAGTSLSCV